MLFPSVVTLNTSRRDCSLSCWQQAADHWLEERSSLVTLQSTWVDVDDLMYVEFTFFRPTRVKSTFQTLDCFSTIREKTACRFLNFIMLSRYVFPHASKEDAGNLSESTHPLLLLGWTLLLPECRWCFSSLGWSLPSWSRVQVSVRRLARNGMFFSNGRTSRDRWECLN